MLRILAILWAASLCGQTKTDFEGFQALVLSNDRIELTVVPEGASFASLLLRDDSTKMSPLWNPARMAREQGQKSTRGPWTGHFLCVDGFGPVSPEEQAAGLPGHGEAHMSKFDVGTPARQGRTQTLALSTKLPMVQELVRRTIRMVDGEQVVYVDTELESLLPFDRPICWAEHATIGPPFLELGKTVVDMPAVKSATRPYDVVRKPGLMPYRLADFKEFTWPMAPAASGGLVDLRAAPVTPGWGDHTASLMDPARKLAWATALHPEKRLLFGYIFRQTDSPWVQNWESYPTNMQIARGLEFGTQAFDVPRRQVITTGTLFGTPLFRWLPAKSTIVSKFLFFYTKTPAGFTKIDDVRQEGGKIVIEDRTAGKRITLAASIAIE